MPFEKDRSRERKDAFGEDDKVRELFEHEIVKKAFGGLKVSTLHIGRADRDLKGRIFFSGPIADPLDRVDAEEGVTTAEHKVDGKLVAVEKGLIVLHFSFGRVLVNLPVLAVSQRTVNTKRLAFFVVLIAVVVLIVFVFVRKKRALFASIEAGLAEVKGRVEVPAIKTTETRCLDLGAAPVAHKLHLGV